MLNCFPGFRPGHSRLILQVSSLLQNGWSVMAPVPHEYSGPPKMEVKFSNMTPLHDVAQLCVSGHHRKPESQMGSTTSMMKSPAPRGTYSMWDMLKMLSKYV